MASDPAFDVVATDLRAVDRRGADGVVWSLPRGADMNANLVHLSAGGAIGSHTNNEVDVLVVGISGRGVVTVDGERHDIVAATVVAIPKGLARSSAAHDDEDLLYLSVHIARPGPQIAPGSGTRRRSAKEEDS
jgi:quercetin dioxygenase-like cupin family protein